MRPQAIVLAVLAALLLATLIPAGAPHPSTAAPSDPALDAGFAEVGARNGSSGGWLAGKANLSLDDWDDRLASVGDDAQLANIDLQNQVGGDNDTEDWFVLDLAAHQRFHVTIEAAEGDIEAQIRDDSGAILANLSTTGTNLLGTPPGGISLPASAYANSTTNGSPNGTTGSANGSSGTNSTTAAFARAPIGLGLRSLTGSEVPYVLRVATDNTPPICEASILHLPDPDATNGSNGTSGTPLGLEAEDGGFEMSDEVPFFGDATLDVDFPETFDEGLGGSNGGSNGNGDNGTDRPSNASSRPTTYEFRCHGPTISAHQHDALRYEARRGTDTPVLGVLDTGDNTDNDDGPPPAITGVIHNGTQGPTLTIRFKDLVNGSLTVTIARDKADPPDELGRQGPSSDPSTEGRIAIRTTTRPHVDGVILQFHLPAHTTPQQAQSPPCSFHWQAYHGPLSTLEPLVNGSPDDWGSPLSIMVQDDAGVDIDVHLLYDDTATTASGDHSTNSTSTSDDDTTHSDDQTNQSPTADPYANLGTRAGLMVTCDAARWAGPSIALATLNGTLVEPDPEPWYPASAELVLSYSTGPAQGRFQFHTLTSVQAPHAATSADSQADAPGRHLTAFVPLIERTSDDADADTSANTTTGTAPTYRGLIGDHISADDTRLGLPTTIEYTIRLQDAFGLVEVQQATINVSGEASLPQPNTGHGGTPEPDLDRSGSPDDSPVPGFGALLAALAVAVALGAKAGRSQ